MPYLRANPIAFAVALVRRGYPQEGDENRYPQIGARKRRQAVDRDADNLETNRE